MPLIHALVNQGNVIYHTLVNRPTERCVIDDDRGRIAAHFGVMISLYRSFSTRVDDAMLYGMTMLLMSKALSPRRRRRGSAHHRWAVLPPSEPWRAHAGRPSGRDDADGRTSRDFFRIAPARRTAGRRRRDRLLAHVK